MNAFIMISIFLLFFHTGNTLPTSASTSYHLFVINQQPYLLQLESNYAFYNLSMESFVPLWQRNDTTIQYLDIEKDGKKILIGQPKQKGWLFSLLDIETGENVFLYNNSLPGLFNLDQKMLMSVKAAYHNETCFRLGFVSVYNQIRIFDYCQGNEKLKSLFQSPPQQSFDDLTFRMEENNGVLSWSLGPNLWQKTDQNISAHTLGCLGLASLQIQEYFYNDQMMNLLARSELGWIIIDSTLNQTIQKSYLIENSQNWELIWLQKSQVGTWLHFRNDQKFISISGDQIFEIPEASSFAYYKNNSLCSIHTCYDLFEISGKNLKTVNQTCYFNEYSNPIIVTESDTVLDNNIILIIIITVSLIGLGLCCSIMVCYYLILKNKKEKLDELERQEKKKKKKKHKKKHRNKDGNESPVSSKEMGDSPNITPNIVVTKGDIVQSAHIDNEEEEARDTFSFELTKTNPPVYQEYTNEKSYASSTTTATLCAQGQELSIPAFLLYKYGLDFRPGSKYIAKGGFCKIYECEVMSYEMRQRSGSNKTVVKVFNQSLNEMSERMVGSFFQELSLMWRLRENSSFIQVYGYSENPACVVMKYYTKGTLEGFILNTGPANKKHAYNKKNLISILVRFSQAIEYMHNIGFVHCDIKPSNVLLEDKKGVLLPVVSDFGITQIVDSSTKLVKEFQITNLNGASVAYAAPEALLLLRSKKKMDLDEQTIKKKDIYSMAMMIEEMLIRKHLWRKGQTISTIVNENHTAPAMMHSNMTRKMSSIPPVYYSNQSVNASSVYQSMPNQISRTSSVYNSNNGPQMYQQNFPQFQATLPGPYPPQPHPNQQPHAQQQFSSLQRKPH